MPFFKGLRTGSKGLRPTRREDTIAVPTPQAEMKQLWSMYVNNLASTGGRLYGDTSSEPWPIERAIAEGYQRIVWIFKGTNVIAGSAARLPYRLKEGDKPIPEDEHPVSWLLNGPKANQLETGPQLRKRLSAQVILSRYGCFTEQVFSRRQTLKEAHLLPPGRTRIVPGTGDDLVSHFEVTTDLGRVRTIEPENVLWFRDPHPFDPFMGVTPLDPAKFSAELDHFARVYNLAFAKSDGRPGGILAVRPSGEGEPMGDEEMDRIEERFGHGPVEAGKLTVISGDMTYTDTAAKPRDMAYSQLAQNAKIEVLSALGVGETLLGYTANRTFTNASEEGRNFWLVEPMPTHLDILTTGWDRTLDDGQEGWFDDAAVAVLQEAKAKLREEARTEVDKGLRSIISYARLAGYAEEDKIEDTPQTRALWIPSGRTPLPSREEDKDALGQGDGSGAPGAPGDAAGPPADPAAGGPGPAADGAPGAAPAAGGGTPPPGTPTAPAAPVAAPAASAPAAAAGSGPGGQRTAAEVLASVRGQGPAAARPATKTERKNGGRLRVVDGGRRARPRATVTVQVQRKDDPAADEEASRRREAADALEAAVAAALAALATRYVERTTARLQSPKVRKGTRHWTPQYAVDTRVGGDALDTAKVVDAEGWEDDAQAAARDDVQAAADAAAAQAAASSGATEGDAVVAAAVAAAGAAAVAAVLTLVRGSAARQAETLATLLAQADQAGSTLEELVSIVRARKDPLVRWAHGVAVQAATATIEGATEEVFRGLVDAGWLDPDVVRREWRSRRDDRVRPSHRKADGQKVGLREPFVVGDSLLRYPGDPLAPLTETAGCRCFVVVRVGRAVVSAAR